MAIAMLKLGSRSNPENENWILATPIEFSFYWMSFSYHFFVFLYFCLKKIIFFDT